jgi:hypothetical protein
MLLAKACGITIPELRLVTVGDKDVMCSWCSALIAGKPQQGISVSAS